MDIDKITVAVEIDGQPYLVLIPDGSTEILIHMIQGLSNNGKLNVVKAPEGFRFESLADKESGCE